MGPSHGPVAWGTMGRRRSTRHLVAVVVLAVVASLLSAVAPAVTPRVDSAAAVDGADFRPGDIISDAVFFNADSMGEAQLQAFLNSQVPSCAGANGWPCLKDIRTDSASRAAAGDGHCTAYQGGTGESAARIIVKVAKACRINPQVLVAMLQKEQGLVTAVSPTERQYRVAMGYACPDTAPCDTQYYGFANQVYMAAWQMRQYTNFPDRRYRIGAVSIQYHPNTACGSSTVNIVNQATANLYNYTPYQPNAAALANLGGVGDACSSYGNRNFWVYMNTWFGPTNTRDNPFGNIEVLTTSLGKFRLAGWAIDPNTTSPIDLHVYINGTGHRVTADLARPDVAAVPRIRQDLRSRRRQLPGLHLRLQRGRRSPHPVRMPDGKGADRRPDRRPRCDQCRGVRGHGLRLGDRPRHDRADRRACLRRPDGLRVRREPRSTRRRAGVSRVRRAARLCGTTDGRSGQARHLRLRDQHRSRQCESPHRVPHGRRARDRTRRVGTAAHRQCGVRDRARRHDLHRGVGARP